MAPTDPWHPWHSWHPTYHWHSDKNMDFYVILGLGPGASPAEIKRAYRRLSRRYHPGVNPGDRQAQAVFERVTQAYETLNDPARRREYDAAGAKRPAASYSRRRAGSFNRLLIALRAQGLSYQEIGDAAGIRHSSVGRLLTRALDRLQNELDRQG